jgi:broad-specificity NMP kinase
MHQRKSGAFHSEKPEVDWKKEAEEEMKDIILGGPKTGKTTLANELGEQTGRPVFHTDDLIPHMEWSELSEYVCNHWVTMEGDWIIEGVAACRALRKFLATGQTMPPDLTITVLTTPKVTLTPRQAALGKATETIWNEIEANVLISGATIKKL